MTVDQLAIGKRIYTLRKEKGISCVKTAMELRISESLLRKVESGERLPSIRLLMELSAFYGVSTDYLLKGPRSSPFSDHLDSVIEGLQFLRREMGKNTHT